MNHKIQLLDCTLRDGGYVNDWNFGKDTTAYLFERLVSSKVDIIEVGFLDERRAYDPNRTIMPNSEAVEKNFAKFDHGDAMVVGMIDFGTCGIENLKPCAESCLDGIRVIFKKEKCIRLWPSASRSRHWDIKCFPSWFPLPATQMMNCAK